MDLASFFLLMADLVDECVGWFPVGLLPELRKPLALDYSRAGLVLTAHLLGGYLGSAVGGVLADLVDRRRLMIGGAALYGVGLALAGAAPNLAGMLVACLCIGLASGPLVHTAQLVLVDRARARGERLEWTLARFNMLGSVGDLLGPGALVVGLGLGLGWRTLFFFAAAVVALYGLAVGASNRRPLGPPGLAGEDEPRPGWAQIREALADRRLLRLGLALALLDALDEPFAGFVLLYLRDMVGAPAAWANTATGILAASTLAGLALASRISWPRTRLLRALPAVMALALAGVQLAPGFVPKTASLALLGGASAGFYTVALAEALCLRPRLAGTATAVISTLGASSLLFPPLVGMVADRAGLRMGMTAYTLVPLAMLAIVAGGSAGRADDPNRT